MWFFWWSGDGDNKRFMMGFLVFMGFFAMGLIRNTWIALIFFSIVAVVVIANLVMMQEEQRAERRPPVIKSTAPTSITQEHALKAARLAGINPETARILPIDIGMVGYDNRTTLYRVWRIDDHVDTLRPFINLRVKQFARGTLRFEIYDDADEMCFFFEREYDLAIGENLIMAQAHMPVDKARAKTGTWKLRVFGDDLLLAEHHFQWQSRHSDTFEVHIGDDGELNESLRAMLASTRLNRMSLEELLADDEADDPAKKRLS